MGDEVRGDQEAMGGSGADIERTPLDGDVAAHDAGPASNEPKAPVIKVRRKNDSKVKPKAPKRKQLKKGEKPPKPVIFYGYPPPDPK